jgi:Uri superfamily endonuclease
LPGGPGCYALVLHLSTVRTLVVGALGAHELGPGWYVYCGSAQGPGGLRGRVGRHLRPSPVRRWHVDYLRQAARLVAVWLWPGAPRAHECVLAARLAALPCGARVVPGFGSSDCRCPGHLIAVAPGGQNHQTEESGSPGGGSTALVVVVVGAALPASQGQRAHW